MNIYIKIIKTMTGNDNGQQNKSELNTSGKAENGRAIHSSLPREGWGGACSCEDRGASAGLLFSRILSIVRLLDSDGSENINKLMHETLVAVCDEGLKDESIACGNLFSQVDFLCKRHNIRTADRVEIQTMRRHSNRRERLTEEELKYDLMALCRFTSAVTGTHIPGELLARLPDGRRPYAKAEGADMRYVRCIVSRWDERYIYVSAESGFDGMTIAVDCSADDLLYLKDLLRAGMQLNLLDSKVAGRDGDGGATVGVADMVVVPGLVVVEPDYLIDISSLAACFKDYGHNALTYIIERMRPRANSQAILLGNLAGGILDDVINSEAEYCLAETVRSNYREKVLEYATCDDFNAAGFKQAAAVQASNIRKSVDVLLKSHDRGAMVLEPSFVCERLGLQGRVDLMTTNFRLLVEQKSGRNRNVEFHRTGSHGSMQLEPHYVQLLLYYGVLRYNFNLGFDRTDIRLLYSKYKPEEGLMAVAFYQALFREALRLRNEIVATSISIADFGFERWLTQLTPTAVNTAGCSSAFYHNYLLPQIESVTKPLESMPPLEREYFSRMMTFVSKEQLLGKVGRREGHDSCTADLWNMPVAEKIETGNIYLGLTIKAKEASEEDGAYDRITLRVPETGVDFLPNFRRGDMVYLYCYAEGQEPDVRRSILYKGNIDRLRTDEITVVLADGQKNLEILKPQDADGRAVDERQAAFYAVEHAGTDAAGGNGARGLFELITAPADRRALLLGQRAPERNTDVSLSRSYDASCDDILLAAKQAKDYYLLVGPPGTGKTSRALRFMVEEELTTDGTSVLLMAYTNRAVDEICSMLEDAGIDYLRLGNEYSADTRFKARLVSEAVKASPRLSEIKSRISSVRVITGTTSMLQSRSYIFRLKTFSLAIIDEASQILEPNIIGLLAAHSGGDGQTGRCSIRKFVLVGDHKQLPAVVRQSEEESAVRSEALRGIGLDNCRNSLFERLLRTERAACRQEFVGVLRRHGRMHPEVAAFPCREFYADEQLVPVPLPHQQETALSYPADGMADDLDRLLHSRRMIFIPSPDCRRPDISEKANTAEAAIVADLLRRIHRLTGAAFEASKTVGVIVPYRNQIAVIRKEIEHLGMPELEQVSIDTVERYQGSQRDVIIYSFTIQNPWQLDFLSANCFIENGHTIDRKLNVALTRARRQMIMTGNERTLRLNPLFRELIDYVRQLN